jgi:hypothetical protein
MAAIEGARRIKQFGKFVLALGSLCAVILWVVAEATGKTKVGPLEQLVAFLFLPLFFGGILWICGWILEGFLKPAR